MFMAFVSIGTFYFLSEAQNPKKQTHYATKCVDRYASTFCSEDYGWAQTDPKQLTDVIVN